MVGAQIPLSQSHPPRREHPHPSLLRCRRSSSAPEQGTTFRRTAAAATLEEMLHFCRPRVYGQNGGLDLSRERLLAGCLALISYARTSDFSPILGAFIIICKTGAVADIIGHSQPGPGPHLGTPIISATGPVSGLETAGLLLISPCLNRLALEACASLAKSNACSSVLGRLGANPARRQASVTPAPRLRSWLAS